MTPLAISAFILSVLGWASYAPVAKIPFLRSTMWPTWAIIVAAAIMGGVAVALEKSIEFATLGPAAASWILLFLFVVAYTTVLRIPVAPGRPEVGKRIVPFKVIGETGDPVSPQDYQGRGPLLLVFFRGFW